MIRVLVVDDSAFMRKVISDIINEDPGMEVIGTARDGEEALSKIEQLKPDVVTLDVEMPKLNGIEVLRRIMPSNPVAVVMVSSLTREGADITIEALTLGAVDFVAKPTGAISVSMREMASELRKKIRAASLARLVGPRDRSWRPCIMPRSRCGALKSGSRGSQAGNSPHPPLESAVL